MTGIIPVFWKSKINLNDVIDYIIWKWSDRLESMGPVHYIALLIEMS